MRLQQKKFGIMGEGLANVCLVDAPYRHAAVLQGAIKGFTGDVVPVGACFIVDKQYQTVIKTARTEMVSLPVDVWCQTDATVADDSKAYQERLPGQLALGDVMIGHLAHEQGASVA